jgi:hypothetical protein
MTYFVNLRLRRTTTKYAYVNVPVVLDVIKPDEQGVGRIDLGELARRAIEMANSADLPNAGQMWVARLSSALSGVGPDSGYRARTKQTLGPA